MLSIRRARKRAERGGQWMDTVEPDWFLTVDLQKLDMSHDTSCVVAQTIGKGSYNKSGMQAPGTIFWSSRYGFNARQVSCYVLTQAWREEVIARRDALNEKLSTGTLSADQATLPAGLETETDWLNL